MERTVPHCVRDHGFGQDRPRAGEKRTRIVVIVTLTTMVLEIVAGVAFGSMALLADGLHMGSHAVALGLSTAAYVYARRHAFDRRFSFGTGKVNALAGYTGAVLLGGFAVFMAVESVGRFLNPVDIEYGWAIGVAVLGLIVNALSIVVLGGHGHGADHDHDQDDHDEHEPEDEDHNLRSAYLHVIADALTSVLAIAALLSGRYLGLSWLDPAMGVAGSLLVAHWSIGLLRETARTLLDHQSDPEVAGRIHDAIEAIDGARVTDLHVWSIGPGIRAATIAAEAEAPLEADDLKGRLPDDVGLEHVTIEVVRPARAYAPGDDEAGGVRP